MNPTRAALLVLILAILGIAAWMIFGSQNGAAPPIVPTDGGPRVVEVTDAETEVAPSEEHDAGPRERREVVDSGSAAPVDDPLIAAALCGFRGRLVTAESVPIPDFSVELFRVAQDSVIPAGMSPMIDRDQPPLEPKTEAGSTRSDEAGKFLITGVWPQGFYALRAGKEEGQPALRFISTTPGPGEIVDLGDIQLAPAGTIVGRVVNEDGEPVANAWIRAIDLPGAMLSMVPVHQVDPSGGVIADAEGRQIVLDFPAWVEKRIDELPIPMTWTDGDGRFRLGGVPPGDNYFAASRSDLLPFVQASVRVVAAEEKDLGEIELREGEWVEGVVMDAAGEPIEGAEIMAAAASGLPVNFGRFAKNTDAQGKFELGGFPNGNAIVAARRSSGDPWHVTEQQPVVRRFEITLNSAHTLKVSVLTEDGNPIAEPRFQITPGRLGEGSIEMAMWGVTEPIKLEERTARDEEGRWVFTDLAAGHYALLVEADDFARTAVAIDLKADQEVEARMRPSTAFEVLVTDDVGTPVKNADIYVEARGPRPRIPEFPVHGGRTDKDGRHVVDALQCAEARVTAYHPAFGNVHAEHKIADGLLTLQMERPGKIVGRLTEKGGVPTPGKWTLTFMRRRSGGPRGAMEDMPRMIIPDLEGNFEAGGLRPGKYEIQPINSISAIGSPGAIFQMMQLQMVNRSRVEKEVELAPGGVETVNLDTEVRPEDIGPAARITGTILVSGRPPGRAVVSAWSNGHSSRSEVDENGRFDLGLVAVGDANLSVQALPEPGAVELRSDSIWQQSLKVEEGKDQDLMIQFDLSSVSGTLFGVDGRPTEGRIRLNGKPTMAGEQTNNSSIWRQTRANQDGTFTFERVPVGTYKLSAESKSGRAEEVAVETTAGLQLTGVRIQMEQRTWVRGSVDMTAFETRPNWLWIRFKAVEPAANEGNRRRGGTESTWANVGDDGSASFEMGDLGPGRYTIELHAHYEDKQDQWEHPGELVLGTTDIEGFTIRPRKKAQ